MITGQISAYMDYWMDGDDGFSSMLDDDSRVVESVDYYGEGDPLATRAVITFDDNIVLLFPAFDPAFKYE
jgi:hypothetical protein